jgi:hypothetical protein
MDLPRIQIQLIISGKKRAFLVSAAGLRVTFAKLSGKISSRPQLGKALNRLRKSTFRRVCSSRPWCPGEKIWTRSLGAEAVHPIKMGRKTARRARRNRHVPATA